MSGFQIEEAGVRRELEPRGLVVKAFDCYRPTRAVAHFVRWARDLRDTKQKAEFYVRQIAAAVSPSNFLATNPELLKVTLEQHGENLVRGMHMLAEDIERGGTGGLAKMDAILVPGGFGVRGTEGKIHAVRFARERGVPYLGICLGMQCAVIDVARHLAKMPQAHSTEFSPNTPHPVICKMEEQKKVKDLGGTMRLGAYTAKLRPGSKVAQAYGSTEISERHRHRYEVNNAYVGQLQRAGLMVSGINARRHLVEIVELKDHPWFLAVQFHPEFQSKPNRAHPLFAAFIAATMKRKGKKKK